MNKGQAFQHMYFWVLLSLAMLPFLLLVVQVSLKSAVGIEIEIFDSRLFVISIVCGVIWAITRF